MSDHLPHTSDLAQLLVSKGFARTGRSINKNEALVWVASRGLARLTRQLIDEGAEVDAKHGSEERTALMAAVRNDHCDAMRVLLDSNATVSMQSKSGLTALHYAAMDGCCDAIRLLVEKGAAVASRCRKGVTPLMDAVCDHHQALRVLHELGGDVNDGNDEGFTPLHRACESGNMDSVRALIELGANMSSKAKNGMTPLHSALEFPEVVEYLISRGADVLEQDGEGETSLTHAAEFSFQPTIELLLGPRIELGDSMNINQRNRRGMTALSVAAAHGHVVLAQFLIQRGSDLAASDNLGRQALHHAAAGGHAQMVQLLVERGADMEARCNGDRSTPVFPAAIRNKNSVVYLLCSLGAQMGLRDSKGASLLHHAIDGSNKALARFLIEKGADLDSRCNNGFTPLLDAVKMKDPDLISLLLRHGADVNASDVAGSTSCHFAAARGYDTILETLLDHHADINIKDNAGRSPLDLAVSQGHTSAQKIINERLPVSVAVRNESAAESVAMLVILSSKGPVAQILRLLETGVNVNAVDFDGRRALTSAAESGNLTITRALLRAGADVNLADRTGETPLWWASRYNHKRVVWELLYRGAQPDLADNEGQSPLSVAAQKGHMKVAKLLLQFGSKPDASVVHGKSALMLAASAGHSGVVAALLRHGAEINFKSLDDETALSLVEKDGNSHVMVRRLLRKHGALPRGRYRRYELAKCLHDAASQGRIPEILRLIKVGVSPDFFNGTKDDTILGGAAAAGETRAVEVLLHHGAFVDGRRHDGTTPIALAARHGREATVRILRDHGAGLDIKDDEGRTALMHACYEGQPGMVALLLELGAKKEEKDSKGMTPLFHAILSNREMVRETILEDLLMKGCNMEVANQDGQTPLSLAVQQGKRGTAQILLSRGAQTTTTDIKEGQAPLSLAASNEQESCVDLLIDHGVDLDHGSHSQRRTALHYAAVSGYGMVVKILIQAGAKVDLVDNHGRTALSLAKEKGHEECVKLLTQAASLLRASQRARRKNEENALDRKGIYRYHRISSKTSIRLLNLLPGQPGDILAVDIEEVDLDDKPSFEALSYEWREKTGTIPIQCGDKRILVTPNCKAAMERLRLASTSRLLWIDAICINQRDVAERTQQVALMTKIYHCATSVLMWLGPSDAVFAPTILQKTFDTLPVLARVQDLLQPNSNESFSFGKSLPISEHPEAQKLADEALSDKEVASCIELLFWSTYFTRAWIFQEAVLAGVRGVVFKGSCKCEWPLFMSAMGGFFAHSGLSNQPLQTILAVTDIIKRDTKVELAAITNHTSHFKAGDVRDLIFASLGLATDEPGRTLKCRRPVANYSMTTQEVFRETARYLIDTAGFFLFGHHRRSAKSMTGLPSWVPDFTYSKGSGLDTESVEPLPMHNEQARRLIEGQATTTETSLFVNGTVLDRLVFKMTMTKEVDTVSVVVAIARVLSERGCAIFDGYLDKFRDGSPVNPLRSYGAIVLSLVLKRYDLSEALEEKVISYLAWRLSTCDEIHINHRQVPRHLESGVDWWRRLSEKFPRDFDLYICRVMDLHLRVDRDLILTERGYIGLSHGGEAEVGMTLCLVGREFCLLEERKAEGEPRRGERFFEFVDMVLLALPAMRLQRLEQLAPGAVVERLEIR